MFTACSLLALPVLSSAGDPLDGSGGQVEQTDYVIEVEPGTEHTDLVVTRTFANASVLAGSLDLDLPLPDEAALLDVRILDGDGRWVDATLIDPDEADRRWQDHEFNTEPEGARATNADTALRVTRDTYSSTLELHPVPPLQQRTVSYRLRFEPEYTEGRYQVELPTFDRYGSPALLRFAPPREAGVSASVDGLSLAKTVDGQVVLQTVELYADQPHQLTIEPDGIGGATRAAQLDLAALGSVDSPTQVFGARFDVPTALLDLPPIRRAVVVLDVSRSLERGTVDDLAAIGGAYLDALARAQPSATVEVMLFDRDVERLYHGFVSSRWAAEDIRKTTIVQGNGSELGLALHEARAALADAAAARTQVDERADWIIVLSDLTMRSDFDVARQRTLAEAAGVRMHVAEFGANRFGPLPESDDWAQLATATGGAGWWVHDDHEAEDIAAEWLAPRRVWTLALERELADGRVERQPLTNEAWTGEAQAWLDYAEDAPSTASFAFVGSVWGRPRSWSAPQRADYGRILASELALDDSLGLTDADREALAHHAQVVSPFTAAFAIAAFDGAPRPPIEGWGSLSGRGFSSSSCCGGCGIGVGTGSGGFRPASTIEDELAAAVDRCPNAAVGTVRFEVTGPEIVAVESHDRCVDEGVWGIDLRVLDPMASGTYTFSHQGAGHPIGELAFSER